jgi:hypothetical protein
MSADRGLEDEIRYPQQTPIAPFNDPQVPRKTSMHEMRAIFAGEIFHVLSGRNPQSNQSNTKTPGIPKMFRIFFASELQLQLNSKLSFAKGNYYGPDSRSAEAVLYDGVPDGFRFQAESFVKDTYYGPTVGRWKQYCKMVC